jgi:NhaA family Na+:H+ antiporter
MGYELEKREEEKEAEITSHEPNIPHLIRPKPPIEHLIRPFQRFIKTQGSSGIVLLVCTMIALIWINSPFASSYNTLWEIKIGIQETNFLFVHPLRLWINDGLMAIFFFVIGLEIKREFLIGELSSKKRIGVPIIAAAGGMVIPAMIYFVINAGTPGVRGWAIPMSTDIAFALGILTLLGKRIHNNLKVFLTALTIIDSIGAILVFAIFYTTYLSWIYLGVAAVFTFCLFVLNWLGVRHPLPYALFGIILWFAFLNSGVHATLAGVLLAIIIPSRARLDTHQFLDRSQAILKQFKECSGEMRGCIPTTESQLDAIAALEQTCEKVETPMQRLERFLDPWIAFLIVPLFTLANAGVSLGGNTFTFLVHPVALGVIFSLIIGKQVGITFFTWIAVRSGIGELPKEVNWRQIYGLGWLSGIGFTIAIFMANLAFEDALLLSTVKVGILIASLIAGIVGLIILRITSSS